jgi:hypothetical protein
VLRRGKLTKCGQKAHRKPAPMTLGARIFR